MQQTTGGGYGRGPDTLNYKFRDVVETEWKRGSVVEVASMGYMGEPWGK